MGHLFLLRMAKNNSNLLCKKEFFRFIGNSRFAVRLERMGSYYQAEGWNRARLFVAVRQRKPLKDQSQCELFECEEFDYFCYRLSDN